MQKNPELRSGRVIVRPGQAGDVGQIVAFFERNREHLAATSPTRPSDFYTKAHWLTQVQRADAGYWADRLMHCFVFLEGDARVVGQVNLSNFVRGAFHACHLGYAVDRELQGTGTMSTAVRLVVEHAFGELGMHRVMANYMPDNERSGRLLARLGFEKEGLARKYLHIAGEWRDHVLTSRVHDAWRPEDERAR